MRWVTQITSPPTDQGAATAAAAPGLADPRSYAAAVEGARDG